MKYLITISLFAALTPTVFGQSALKKLRFLMQADIDPARILPPPADGSEVQKQEMVHFKRLKTRRPERFAQAKWDDGREGASAFAAVLAAQVDAIPITDENSRPRRSVREGTFAVLVVGK
jgi:hypothetical protein